jgi:methyl-accepting chemotaxis protein
MESVGKAAALVENIASASNEQAAGISQISQAIMQISDVVQQNSATAEESAAASEELSSQAEMLKEMVSKFKLKKIQATRNSYDHHQPDAGRSREVAPSGKPQELSAGKKPAPTKKKIDLSKKDFGKY